MGGRGYAPSHPSPLLLLSRVTADEDMSLEAWAAAFASVADALLAAGRVAAGDQATQRDTYCGCF